MKKAHFILIAANEWHNKFMIRADLFEAGKVLGEVQHITVDYKEEVELTLERAAQLLTAMDAKEVKGLIVSFMHLASIEIDEKITYNDGAIKPYWNKMVRIVSSGGKWFMLHDFVKWLGFKVETDEHLYIKSIS